MDRNALLEARALSIYRPNCEINPRGFRLDADTTVPPPRSSQSWDICGGMPESGKIIPSDAYEGCGEIRVLKGA